MTVAELIGELKKLDQSFEVGLLTANAYARPPSIERIDPCAWVTNSNRGFRDVTRAYLLRPEKEII